MVQRLCVISMAMIALPSILSAQESQPALACVGTISYAEELSAVALAHNEDPNLATYIYGEITPDQRSSADILSIVGGPRTLAVLDHPELGLKQLQAKTLQCATTDVCDENLFVTTLAFMDALKTVCRLDQQDIGN